MATHPPPSRGPHRGGGYQCGYITLALPGSPYWGGINMATKPLPSPGPHSEESRLPLRKAYLLQSLQCERPIWLHTHPLLGVEEGSPGISGRLDEDALAGLAEAVANDDEAGIRAVMNPPSRPMEPPRRTAEVAVQTEPPVVAPPTPKDDLLRFPLAMMLIPGAWLEEPSFCIMGARHPNTPSVLQHTAHQVFCPMGSLSLGTILREGKIAAFWVCSPQKQ